MHDSSVDYYLITLCLAVGMAIPMAVFGAVTAIIGCAKRHRTLWIVGLAFLGLSLLGAIVMTAVLFFL